MNKIHLTDTPPPYCASCFSAKPESRHVDMGAAYDGPVINADDGIRITVDDLVICEDCLTEAARALGMEQSPQERLDQLSTELADSVTREEAQAAYITKLEEALGVKPGAERTVEDLRADLAGLADLAEHLVAA